MRKIYYFLGLFIFILNSIPGILYAQCVTPISSFPYNENFELSDGNWVRSSSDHWVWGQITSKPVISSAGGGSKCWVAGGLSGNFYNSGSSFLVSPCFNISTLTNPEISFKIFWETERKYDGASLEYSLDGGSTWQVLGSANSNDCSTKNWFNYNPVNFLGGPGWSGNIQATSGSCQGTGGSGGWLTAKHSLSTLIGNTSLIFRFVFAAGTQCNDYDGVGIDDITIGEAEVNGADYNYTCSGNRIVSFTGSSTGCKTGVVWDFGDIASGGSNTSALDNPTHSFSLPGSYFVSLTTTFSSGQIVVTTKMINVISASFTITNNIKCNGNQTGAVAITVNPPGSYNYTWDTNPVQTTPSIANLGSGNYTVLITGTNTCNVSLPVTLTEPALLMLSTTIKDEKCGAQDGAITSNVSGGTMPYSYLWSDNSSSPSINNLSTGIYSLAVTDNNGCMANVNNLTINNILSSIPIFLGRDTTICPGQTVVLHPGNFSSYRWQDNSTAPTFIVSNTGTYSVNVSNGPGCTGTAQIKITVECPQIFFPTAFTPNRDPWNDKFGPLGDLSAIRNYRLTIYGRWGQEFFSSNDPFKKWDGTYKGKPLPTQVLTWIVTYQLNNYLPVFEKGTLTLFR